MEGFEELIENLGLMLGGTTLGAYFASILRIRHHLKTLFVAATALIAGLIHKKKKPAIGGIQDSSE